MGFLKLLLGRTQRQGKLRWCMFISAVCFIFFTMGYLGKHVLLYTSNPLSKFTEGDSKDLKVAGSLDRLNDGQTRPPFIVILAQWRGGSSIVGQVFNQNPNMFYFFEPLYVVDRLREEDILAGSHLSPEVHSYATGVLREMARCNFTNEYVEIMRDWGGLKQNRAICAALGNDIQTSQCDLQNATWIGNFCSKFGGSVAIKAIRADLENIRPLVEQDGVNAKVIHLVRDPRGAAASRIHYYYGSQKELVEKHRPEFEELGRLGPLGLINVTQKPKDCIQNLCNWMRANMQNASNIPDWLRGRYYLLKYEDFAESPVKVAEDIYKFLGLPFSNEVKSWLVANTQVKKSNASTFALNKNSRETAKKWMSDLSQLEVSQVESVCLDIMEKLGYRPHVDLLKS